MLSRQSSPIILFIGGFPVIRGSLLPSLDQTPLLTPLRNIMQDFTWLAL